MLCDVETVALLPNRLDNFYNIAIMAIYIFSFTCTGRNLVSALLISLFVCSANDNVKIVCGKIRARCAKKPLYMASTPSVLIVLNKQSKSPL